LKLIEVGFQLDKKLVTREEKQKALWNIAQDYVQIKTQLAQLQQRAAAATLSKKS
jgi:hypothetical protein